MRKNRPSIHILKIWPVFFQAVKAGQMPFQVRFDDRNYQVGDMLLLREYNPRTNTYTGEGIACLITYKQIGQIGIEKGYCVLGIYRPMIAKSQSGA